MKNFLLEILSEEIPSDLQEKVAKNFLDNFIKLSSEKGVVVNDQDGKDLYYYSSRRLVLNLNLIFIVINKSEVIRGPRYDISDDILNKFLEKNNYKRDDLIEIEYNQIKYHAIQIKHKLNNDDVEIIENLASICKETLNKVQWPISMIWRKDSQRWIRPIRSVLALYNDKVVDFEFAKMKSSNYSYGHKMMQNNEKIQVEKIFEYKERLRSSKVIVDQGERSNLIIDLCAKYYKDKIDDKLISMVNTIVEWPGILECKIPNDFMFLPHKLIEYSMILHQKYIPLHDKNGNLLDKFLVITDHDNQSNSMKIGYERVLNARLSDAKFFWDRMCNSKIEDLIANLQLIQSEYIPEMTVFDFNNYINSKIDIEHNIHDMNILSCDLGSELYSEFPALRGILAYEYLKKHNYKEEVINIAKEIYFGESELYGRDEILMNGISRSIVALKYYAKLKYYLVDKGEKPTTSRDPFALKRAIKMIYDFNKKLLLSLKENDFVKNVVENYEK